MARSIVPGPYDRPYRTKRQVLQEQRRRTAEATTPVTEIEDTLARERAGAQLITQSFENMLQRQAAQNLAAMQAIQAGSGGAGSALTTSGILGEQQRQAGVPALAAGEGARIQADVEKRGTEAKLKRGEEYRKNLAYFGQQVRDEETEKQAARIERAAAEKAYDLKQREYDRSVLESDRNYELAVQRVNASLASANLTDVSSVVSSIDKAAKAAMASAGKTGTGLWSGVVVYRDPTSGKWEEVKVKDIRLPSDNSKEARDKFWAKYVSDKRQVPIDQIKVVDRSGLAEGTKVGKANVNDVASALVEGMMSQGYSAEEAYSYILRSAFGMANAAAVRRAAGL